MTIHEALFAPACQILMTACLLILAAQLILIFVSFQDNRSRLIKILYILLFVIGFISFYMPMLDICWEHDYPNGELVRSAVLTAYGSLPVTAMIIYEILFGLILIAEFLDLIHYRKNHPIFESIKETMDILPAGIAFGKPDGTVVFSNLAMNALARALTGKGLTDLSVFHNSASSKADTLLTIPGSSAVWQLSNKMLELEDDKYISLTATDITEQAAITNDLEEKNAKLRELHMRLDIYNKQADRIIIAQELLTARILVHNEVGNVLLESKRYLKDPASFDEEKLLQALRNTNTYLLREYEQDDTAGDSLVDALEMAEAIGVDVVIKGVLPEGEPYRRILSAAISECATNTIKHANGDQLSVNIQSTDSGICYILKSNGDTPSEPIRESGGLSSLRSLVEQENGSMQITGSPVFELSIRLCAER